ncbi:MAG TPA: DNRLRE domain-containing protein [Tepidisphaeraceae bacterium]|nr:DNRLRE domain-containing protein [Tepidisphaeraceae bacterium]
MLKKIIIFLISLCPLSPALYAAPITIQPDEAASKDAFVYQGLATSFNSDTYNSGQFVSLLSSGASGSGHDTKTYIQFDLSTIPVGGISNATLNLYVGDSSITGFGGSPTAASPITANVHRVIDGWTESGVMYSPAVSYSSTVEAFQVISGIDAYISFDVTALVQAWLAGTFTNNGFAIDQPSVVVDSVSGLKNIAVYDSASGTHTPFLSVTVPEPAGLVLLSLLPAFAMSRRRERHV